MLTLYFTALAMGFFGSTHCFGMCGGITVALSSSTSESKKLQYSFIFQIFRVVSYAILGGLFGAFGYLFSQVSLPVLTSLSGIFMILLGLYLLNINTPLLGLEKLGHKLWSKIQPLQKRFLPIGKAYHAIVIGLLWGLLPCGLVYSALALSVSTGNFMAGAICMLFFGLGTLPALLSLSLISSHGMRWIKNKKFTIFSAIIFILIGSYYLYSAVQSFQNGHHHHMHHMQMDHEGMNHDEMDHSHH